MKKEVKRVHLDREATGKHILQMAEKKGYTVQEFNKAVREMSQRYRRAAKKKRLCEIERYVVISQVLGSKLDDLFVVVKD